MFSQTTPDEHSLNAPPCRWPALINLPTLAKFQLVWRRLCVVVVLLCSSSSTPLRPSVCYPNINMVVSIMYIRICCDHLNTLYIFDPTRVVLSQARALRRDCRASSLVILPSLPLTPRRHRHADGQLSSLYPPSPSFNSFDAACMKLCCLLPPSRIRNTYLCCIIDV